MRSVQEGRFAVRCIDQVHEPKSSGGVRCRRTGQPGGRQSKGAATGEPTAGTQIAQNAAGGVCVSLKKPQGCGVRASARQAGFSRRCSGLPGGCAASGPVPPALPARRLLHQLLLLLGRRARGGGRACGMLPAPGPLPAGVAGQVRGHTDVQGDRVLREVALRQRDRSEEARRGSGPGLRLATAMAEAEAAAAGSLPLSVLSRRTCRRSDSCGPMCRPCSSEGPSVTEGSSGFCRRGRA